MDEKQCVELLEHHGVKATANRIVVVKALAAADRPMSLSELEYQILTIDKSGVFRALTLFKELCHSHDDHVDDDLHVHFYCEQCRRTYCLEDIKIPPVQLSDGFEMHSVNYMVKGICPHCKERR